MKPAEQYLLDQPEPLREILIYLDAKLTTSFPELELRYKWKVPFYYHRDRPLCYLNATKGYVDLGFWQAVAMEESKSFLQWHGRRMIGSLRFRTLEEVNDMILLSVVREALKLSAKR